MGRPTALTPEIQAIICEAIANGNTREDSAEAGDISAQTLYSWMRRGKKEKDGPYLKFLEAVKKAEAKSVRHFVGIIKKAASTRTEATTKTTTMPDGTVKEEKTTRKVFDWCAAAWWLERRRPEEFGKRETAILAGLEKRLAELESERRRKK